MQAATLLASPGQTFGRGYKVSKEYLRFRCQGQCVQYRLQARWPSTIEPDAVVERVLGEAVLGLTDEARPWPNGPEIGSWQFGRCSFSAERLPH